MCSIAGVYAFAGEYIRVCSEPIHHAVKRITVEFPCLKEGCDKQFLYQHMVIHHARQAHHPEFAGQKVKFFTAYLNSAGTKVTFQQTLKEYTVPLTQIATKRLAAPPPPSNSQPHKRSNTASKSSSPPTQPQFTPNKPTADPPLTPTPNPAAPTPPTPVMLIPTASASIPKHTATPLSISPTPIPDVTSIIADNGALRAKAYAMELQQKDDIIALLKSVWESKRKQVDTQAATMLHMAKANANSRPAMAAAEPVQPDVFPSDAPSDATEATLDPHTD